MSGPSASSVSRCAARALVTLSTLATAYLSPSRAAEGRPELSVSLAATNTGVGLFVPAEGDGANVPEVVQGEPARRVKGEGALYLYVAIRHPAWTNGPAEAYVTVEAFDETIEELSIEYDRDSPSPGLATKYAAASDSMLLVGAHRWRRGVFHLPDLRLGHGQNFGADFRLLGRNIAVRRITVSATPPADYQPGQTLDPESLRVLAVARPAGMEFTVGNDTHATEGAILKALSVGSVESYVDWAGVEPQPGQWDWTQWDRQVAVLREAGLKWVPFLIAGPAYATPEWFQRSPDSHVCRCLEHGRDSAVQSIFNPQLRPQIERFLQAFAARYRDGGAIESVLLGISGIYGESIYAAGPEGGWTANRTGPYHNHAGWWAGDADAAAAFRAAMRVRYGDLAALNRAWGTAHASFDEVAPFLPDRAPGDRARADFVEWYQQAMTDWAVFWVRAARRAFPATELYLCTGGDGNPVLGADFTAQAAAIAPERAGIRITNEGSDYLGNFSITREAATATRHYGTFCGFEPASHVDERGIVARIYNATASGARQLHDYKPNLLHNADGSIRNFRANARFLAARQPRVDAALYLSRESWAFDPAALGRTLELSRVLRDAADLDFVTAADGHLRQYRALVLAESPVLEPAAAAAIEDWVRGGGTLIVATRPGETAGGRLHDLAEWRARLLAAAAPLQVGGTNDENWLTGDWQGRETSGEAGAETMRWSGARSGVYLSLRDGAGCTVRLRVWIPPPALGPSGIVVRAGARTVAVMREAGRRWFEFHRSPQPGAPVRLEFETKTWIPAEVNPGSGDPRSLGFALQQVEVIRDGAALAPAAVLPAARIELVPQALAPLTRAVGQGRTIFLPGLAGDARLLALVLASALPGAPDGRLDGRFATVTDTGVLWFEPAGPSIREEASGLPH